MTSVLAPFVSPELNDKQRAMALLIERQFVAAGWPVAVAAGAIVNAYAESRLNPAAKNGSQIGLFQIDYVHGAGSDHTPEQLVDPKVNIAVTLRSLKRWPGDRIRAAVAEGEDNPARYAYLFCVDVERPANKESKGLFREGLTHTLFPGLVHPQAPEAEVGGALSNGMVGVKEPQRDMAALIEERLSDAGLPPEIIVAAITNAMAESGLNPKALANEPNGTVSVGLFQLNDGKRSAGAGMSVADRQDPVKNIDRMLQVYRQGAGRPLESAYAAGERDVGVLAALWCVHLERPANAEQRGVQRRALAYRKFPTWTSLVVLPTPTRTPEQDHEPGGGAATAVVLFVMGLGVGALVLARRR